MSGFRSVFSPYMEGMLNYKEALGYSRATFVCFLRQFDKFCYLRFPHEKELTRDLVLEWARQRESESINGLKRRMSTIRQFARYLQSIGISAYLAPAKMTGSEKRYVPHLYTDEELKAFFYGADHIPAIPGDSLNGYMVPVLFRLIYCCGLRPSEPLRLRTNDVNLETGRIFIKESKRHKDRVVVLSDELLQLCRNYVKIRAGLWAGNTIFFPDKKGGFHTAQWLRYQFKRCWRASRFTGYHDKCWRIYDFRHTFATRCLQNWLDEKQDLYFWLPYLSAYMGHGDFSNTAYYIHLLPQRLTVSSGVDWKSFADLLPEVPQ